MSYFRRMKFFNALNAFFSGVLIFCLLFTCEKFEPKRIIKIVTGPVSNVSYNSCSVQGTIIDKGEIGIDQHGFCWSIEEVPTVNDSIKRLGVKNSTGNFSCDLTGLKSGTTYYVRAYAQNKERDFYGDDITFTTWQTPTTTDATSVTDTTATLNGTVNANNFSTIVTFEYGTTISYGTSVTATQSPVSGNNPTTVSAAITGLTKGTTYHFTVKAVSAQGTTYGNDSTFTTICDVCETGTFTDTRDTKEYNWVRIGDQYWMSENLAYLPSVSPASAESYIEPYYYVYDYQGTSVSEARITDNYKTYGVLYNWPAAMNGQSSSNGVPSGVQGVCPAGWHLPSDAEWDVLANYLGGDLIAGGKMKTTGTIEGGDGLWYSPNTDATNEGGFSGPPGGFRYRDGIFDHVEHIGYWWSSTEFLTDFAWNRYLHYYYSGLYKNGYDKEDGFSVRCLRD